MQHTVSQSTCAVPPPCFPVKLRDFESAVSNFEKALERAKLVHNNEAQQAIISVSCPPPWALAVGRGGWASAPQPLSPSVSQSTGIYYPPTAGHILGGIVAFECLLLPSVYSATLILFFLSFFFKFIYF